MNVTNEEIVIRQRYSITYYIASYKNHGLKRLVKLQIKHIVLFH